LHNALTLHVVGSDYTQKAVDTVAKIHTKLPHGGILLFLTGQNEVELA
jgi:HrpA-like RNA helicase